jgi:type V secretory pathway adhesin AidA
VEGSFTATGTERFITIGNFYSKANTNTVLGYFNHQHGYSWLLVDDVSVIPSDLPAYAGPDVWVVSGDSVYIGRPKEPGLECKWYLNGNLVDSGGGIWAKPAVSSTYVVEQTLCGLVKTDTVHVQVVPASVNGISNSRQLSVYPNPASNVLHVQQQMQIFHTGIIVNNVGQQLSSFQLHGKESSLDISSLAPGMYYLQLIGDRGREVRSFVKAPSAP